MPTTPRPEFSCATDEVDYLRARLHGVEHERDCLKRLLGQVKSLMAAVNASYPQRDLEEALRLLAAIEARPPCGGERCFLAADGKAWVHSSKSYGTCSVRQEDLG